MRIMPFNIVLYSPTEITRQHTNYVIQGLLKGLVVSDPTIIDYGSLELYKEKNPYHFKEASDTILVLGKGKE